MTSRRAIDCWVNVTMGEIRHVDYLKRAKEDYFKAGEEFFTSLSVDECLADMDEAGVEKAILTVRVKDPSETVLDFARQHPDRFALAAHVRPTAGLPELWRLEDLATEHPVVMARVVPFDFDLPPSDAQYYPLYTKCVEMDLPLSVNTGLPGPPVPGECQDPIHLDRICYRFPLLRLCMAHGADP